MKITVSDATRALLEAKSLTGKLSIEGTSRLRDGRWEVEVDQDLVVVLASIDPDMDTAILQAITGGRA